MQQCASCLGGQDEVREEVGRSLSMLNDIYIYLIFFRELFLLLFILKQFWLYHMSCGILVSQPGIEPMLPAVEVQSLNHWATRGVPVD